jgi:serine/threonine protein kinase
MGRLRDRYAAMKTCTTCQTECIQNALFCPSCGCPFSSKAPRDDENLVGLCIGDSYRLYEQIGRGAMGAIYKAEQLSLAKDVALKVLHRHLLKDPTLTRRFHREARAASRINHPNCITIIDFGQTDDGHLYIAMEYIDGFDLAEVLYREHPFSYARILHILKQVCMALDEAHALGVIHRDLKPENIMLTQRRMEPDFIKVLDFGIAKITDPKHKKGETFETIAGVVCGTPEYMSPEQARGQVLDARSDLYSLGAILYQLLTDQLPFDGSSPMEVVTRHLTEPVPCPTLVVPGIHPEMNRLTQRLMAKKPEHRPDSARALLDEIVRLEGLLGDTPLPESTTGGGQPIDNPERHRRFLESSETDVYPSCDGLPAPHVLDLVTPRNFSLDRDPSDLTPREMQRLETEATEAPTNRRPRRFTTGTAGPRGRAWLSLSLATIVALGIASYLLMLSSQPTIGPIGSTGETIVLYEQLPGPPSPAAPAMVPPPMRRLSPQDTAQSKEPPVARGGRPTTSETPSSTRASEPKAAPPVTMLVVDKETPRTVAKSPKKNANTSRKGRRTRGSTATPSERIPRRASARVITTEPSDATEAKTIQPMPSIREILDRARSHKAAGQWANVITTYREAYRVRASGRYLKEIGMAYVKLGNMTSACRYFRRSVQRLPSAKRLDAIERLAVFGCNLSL